MTTFRVVAGEHNLNTVRYVLYIVLWAEFRAYLLIVKLQNQVD